MLATVMTWGHGRGLISEGGISITTSMHKVSLLTSMSICDFPVELMVTIFPREANSYRTNKDHVME